MKTTTTMNELDTILNEKASAISLKSTAYQDMLNADDATQKDLNELKSALESLIDEYNDAFKQKAYLSCYQAEKPMLAACQYGELTKKVMKMKQDDGGRWTVSVDDRKVRNALDLVDFEKEYDGKGTLSRNGQWPTYGESLLKAMAKETAANLEVPEDVQKKLLNAYKDAKETGTFANLSATNPSKNNMIKDLQSIVDCIVFEPAMKDGVAVTDKAGNALNALKVTSADVAFIKIRIAKAGKSALATRMASKKEMIRIIGNVMYHLTTGNPYTFDVKA